MKKLMEGSKGLSSALLTSSLLLLTLPSFASHIRETVKFAKGWNAVYLESTPVESSCDAFFSGDLAGVVRVGAYVQSAYSNTSQYDSEGNLKEQKPVSYYVWSRVTGETSTLTVLSGGCCYLVFATNACEKTFLGTPAQPNFIWRIATSSDGFLNFVSPSIPSGETIKSKLYFGEGPAGAQPTAYQISGQGAAPTVRALGGVVPDKLSAGRAYAMTAVHAGDWPGVFRVGGLTYGAISFGTTETKVAFTLSNLGTTNRTFRLTPRASEDSSEESLSLSRFVKQDAFDAGGWSNLTNGTSFDLSVAAGSSQTLTFGLDRTTVTNTSAAYGSLLEIADLSGTKMRVRIPVVAAAKTLESGESAEAGLWVGAVQLDEVSMLNNSTPLPAAGKMQLTALVHVDAQGHPTLLPRIAVAYGVDTNNLGATLYHELADVPEAATSKRRLTGLVMPTSASPVRDAGHLWGDAASFTYEIGAMATDNPFRHAWHPDHDGVNSLYDAAKTDGSETWSVTNVLSFAWKKADGSRYYNQDADGISAGVVTWTVTGIAKNPIVARGMFSFTKILSVSKIEED